MFLIYMCFKIKICYYHINSVTCGENDKQDIKDMNVISIQNNLQTIPLFYHKPVMMSINRMIYFDKISSIESMTAPLKPFFSKVVTPLIVVPPGEQTLSFISAG